MLDRDSTAPDASLVVKVLVPLRVTPTPGISSSNFLLQAVSGGFSVVF